MHGTGKLMSYQTNVPFSSQNFRKPGNRVKVRFHQYLKIWYYVWRSQAKSCISKINQIVFGQEFMQHIWGGASIKYVSKIFRKTNISNPLIRNVSFLENFAYVLNWWPLDKSSNKNFALIFAEADLGPQQHSRWSTL